MGNTDLRGLKLKTCDKDHFCDGSTMQEIKAVKWTDGCVGGGERPSISLEGNERYAYLPRVACMPERNLNIKLVIDD